MIEAALTAFGAGGASTAILTALIKLINVFAEASERKTLLMAREREGMVEAMDALAARTNNLWGHSARFMIILVPQIVILVLLWVGYNNPDAIIWYGQTDQPTHISLLFGLIEFTGKPETTWREFNGIVVLPIVFLQAGAGVGYYLTNGMFSRR